MVGNLTHLEEITSAQEIASTKELPSSLWPLSMSAGVRVGYSFDCSLMEQDVA